MQSVLVHPHGESTTVFNFGDQNTFIKDCSVLNKMLNHPKVKDRKIVVISIIGSYRGGKSFFIDYCLRYLYSKVNSIFLKT